MLKTYYDSHSVNRNISDVFIIEEVKNQLGNENIIRMILVLEQGESHLDHVHNVS